MDFSGIEWWDRGIQNSHTINTELEHVGFAFLYAILHGTSKMKQKKIDKATRIIRDPQSAVRNHHVPVIAMTAYAMKGDREKCLEAGMNDYIPKPIEPQSLVDALEKWLPQDKAIT